MQLTLGMTLRDDATFDNYFAGNNRQVIHHLREMMAGCGEHFIYLYGEAGVGVSHLLQACCHEAKSPAIYLPLSEPHLTPEVLQNLESIDFVCLDDIEHVLGDCHWEEALLHFYNRVREQSNRLVIGAKALPAFTPCFLPDLKSRLSWGLVLPMVELQENEKITTLQLRAEQRGLLMSLLVAQFLLRQHRGNMTTLFHFLDRLDKASLQAKRRLTIPFVKEVLAEDEVIISVHE
ncbi:MAG: DnaA regulatory inactivator Hda [Coxiella sp. RIFCSPHIGHO2_12_FULL_42_15]|nr:MAG: DnaA regulatory inactivator Hda [Coxiella sp. RIFCSPHIGHO2_12_FULL_42_15]